MTCGGNVNRVVAFTLIFLINTSAIVIFSPVLASELATDSWNIKTPIPVDNSQKYQPSNVVFEGKIYVIGGGPTMNYDPKTDTWITLTPIPTPRDRPSVAVYQGKIYCISGYVEDETVTVYRVYRHMDIVEVYDPVKDSWSKKASVPIEVRPERPFNTPIQACVVNDQLFAIGPKGELYQYNPSADRWTRKASLAVEAIVQVYVMNKQLFVITQNGEQTEMYMYDSTTDVWTKKADPPVAAYSFGVVVDDKIIVGNSQTNAHTYRYEFGLSIYDSKTDMWSEGTPSPQVRFFYRYPVVGMTAGVYAPKKVYVFGNEQFDRDTLRTFSWVYDPVDNVWSTAKTMPDSYRLSASGGSDELLVVDDVFYMLSNFFNKQYDPDIGVQYIRIGVQYVPIGYSPHETTPSEQIPSEPIPSEPILSLNTPMVVAIIAISLAVAGLCFYLFKKGAITKKGPGKQGST